MINDGQAATHKFKVDEGEGYLTVALDDNGKPSELFVVTTEKMPLLTRGLLEVFRIGANIMLGRGDGIINVIDAHRAVEFSFPFVENSEPVNQANETVQHLCAWLSEKFPGGVWHHWRPLGIRTTPNERLTQYEDEPSCSTCGSRMIRSGSCWKCVNCGNTFGCT